MGSAAAKLLRQKEVEIQFAESTKMPTAKDEDTRKRNSLMYFMRDWQGLTTFEQQEASMVQVTARNHTLKYETARVVMKQLTAGRCCIIEHVARDQKTGMVQVKVIPFAREFSFYTPNLYA